MRLYGKESINQGSYRRVPLNNREVDRGMALGRVKLVETKGRWVGWGQKSAVMVATHAYEGVYPP